MKRKTLLLGFACAAALWAVFLAVNSIPEGYRKFLLLQAMKQQPVGLRDAVLSEMKAKMFGAGYEVGRAADLNQEPSSGAVLQWAHQAARILGVRLKDDDICVARYKAGFDWGLHDARNAELDRRQKEFVGR